MPTPSQLSGKVLDNSARFYSSSTVVGSPAAASATNICQITGIDTDTAVYKGVRLEGCIAFTVGTNGTAVTFKIRQGTTAGSGTTVFNSGATTATAANLVVATVLGIDTTVTGGGAVGSTSYFIEMTVTGGTAASTVSAVTLTAQLI